MVPMTIYLGQQWCELEEDRQRAGKKNKRSVILLSMEHMKVMQHSINTFLFLSSPI